MDAAEMSAEIERAAEGAKKIHLTLLNGTGYVFNVDDYMTLRTQHRIIGALAGTSSTHGWSASESTLPVELSPCETRLLIAEGIAVLLSKQQSLLRKPTPSEQQDYQQQLTARLEEQADALKAEKLREAERNMDKIIAGKRKQLQRKGEAANDTQLEPADILQSIADNIKFERKNVLMDISCAHAQSHTADVVQLPPDDSLKYSVFRDFWQRGKYVTAGDAFGADFLIYPGDPLLYHASHIVILLPDGKLQPLELIAKVRLSVIVNKLCVFAYFAAAADGEAAPELHYQTVRWEGNRDKERLCNVQDF